MKAQGVDSLNLEVDGVGGQCNTLAAWTLERATVPIVREVGER